MTFDNKQPKKMKSNIGYINISYIFYLTLRYFHFKKYKLQNISYNN
ncbi:unnamed protein product [Paramecium octaurelia]|uniref:Uncharacterized protein n=1 Tax=Paramecium octaurelia TaxID=43137 RepID=A0A8S1RYB8_PAROT|nr:unnamed protein product [Paramecium octaurelia]